MKTAEFSKRLAKIKAHDRNGEHRDACRLATRTLNEYEHELTPSQKSELEILERVMFRKAMQA